MKLFQNTTYRAGRHAEGAELKKQQAPEPGRSTTIMSRTAATRGFGSRQENRRDGRSPGTRGSGDCLVFAGRQGAGNETGVGG
jgi:hypothetical protein